MPYIQIISGEMLNIKRGKHGNVIYTYDEIKEDHQRPQQCGLVPHVFDTEPRKLEQFYEQHYEDIVFLFNAIHTQLKSIKLKEHEITIYSESLFDDTLYFLFKTQ